MLFNLFNPPLISWQQHLASVKVVYQAYQTCTDYHKSSCSLTCLSGLKFFALSTERHADRHWVSRNIIPWSLSCCGVSKAGASVPTLAFFWSWDLNRDLSYTKLISPHSVHMLSRPASAMMAVVLSGFVLYLGAR